MFTKETAIAQVTNFLADCAQNDITFDSVYLFGSFNNNTYHEDSDIDLLLVSDKFTDDKWNNLKLIAKMNKKYFFIDAHTFSKEYFSKGDPFINEITQKGYKLI